MRAYGGHATITIAIAAFLRPRPSTAATTIARMIGGNANTRSVPRMQSAVERAAEVAGDRADDRADRRGERDDEERERQRHPGAVDHAAEDVAAELVGAEEVLPRRPRSKPGSSAQADPPAR